MCKAEWRSPGLEEVQRQDSDWRGGASNKSRTDRKGAGSTKQGVMCRWRGGGGQKIQVCCWLPENACYACDGPALLSHSCGAMDSGQCCKAVALPDLNLPDQAQERSGPVQSVSGSTEQSHSSAS